MSTYSETMTFFLDDCQARNLSQRTFSIYRFRLEKFQDYLKTKAIDQLADITPDVLRAYIALMRPECSPATLHQIYRTLCTFFTWCFTQGKNASNPFLLLRPPKLPTPPPRGLKVEDIAKLFACTKQTQHPIRNMAILALLLDGGFRRQELLDLTLADVDTARRVVVIRHGKGGKARQVPISKYAIQALEEWLKVRPEGLRTLFGISPKGLVSFFQRISVDCGFRVYAHCLRHTFASLYEGDIQDLQRILGHADVSTTATIYRHRGIDTLVRVHDTRTPLSICDVNI